MEWDLDEKRNKEARGTKTEDGWAILGIDGTPTTQQAGRQAGRHLSLSVCATLLQQKHTVLSLPSPPPPLPAPLATATASSTASKHARKHCKTCLPLFNSQAAVLRTTFLSTDPRNQAAVSFSPGGGLKRSQTLMCVRTCVCVCSRCEKRRKKKEERRQSTRRFIRKHLISLSI